MLRAQYMSQYTNKLTKCLIHLSVQNGISKQATRTVNVTCSVWMYVGVVVLI